MPRLLNVIKHISNFTSKSFSSSTSSSSSSVNVFNHKVKQIQRERAISQSDSHIYDYLKEEIAYRVADRVFDIKRQFSTIVDLGCHKGQIAANLIDGDIVDRIVCCSSSQASLDLIEDRQDAPKIEKLLVEDEENYIASPLDSIDLIISSLHLHWINDLPKLFGNVFASLKPDGVFIGSMFGGQTLFELRCSLQMAESEREGGFAPHVSPFVTPQDIGALLSRAGFTMLTIDADEIVVRYPSIFELMYDLKGMAENGALLRGRTHLHRDSLLAAAAIYDGIYGREGNGEESSSSSSKIDEPQASSSPNDNPKRSIPATFQVFYFIGWKPHPSQPKPLQPGSANFSLKDLAHLGRKSTNGDDKCKNK